MKKFGKRGFTLIEMLVVLVVIGLLVAIAIPRFFGVSNDAKIRQCDGNVRAIDTAIELYNERTENYPTALTDVTQSTSYFPDGEPKCPFGTDYAEEKDDSNSYVVGVTNHSH